MNFTFDQLVSLAQISPEDMVQINRCRRDHNRFVYNYQLSLPIDLIELYFIREFSKDLFF